MYDPTYIFVHTHVYPCIYSSFFCVSDGCYFMIRFWLFMMIRVYLLWTDSEVDRSSHNKVHLIDYFWWYIFWCFVIWHWQEFCLPIYIFISVNHIAGHPLRLVRSSMESRHIVVSGPRVVFYLLRILTHIHHDLSSSLGRSSDDEGKMLINIAGRKPKTSKKSDMIHHIHTIYIFYQDNYSDKTYAYNFRCWTLLYQ